MLQSVLIIFISETSSARDKYQSYRVLIINEVGCFSLPISNESLIRLRLLLVEIDETVPELTPIKGVGSSGTSLIN